MQKLVLVLSWLFIFFVVKNEYLFTNKHDDSTVLRGGGFYGFHTKTNNSVVCRPRSGPHLVHLIWADTMLLSGKELFLD